MGRASSAGALLGTVLHGLGSRRSLSAGCLFLSTVAVASAVLGPSYSAAASQSFLVTRLSEAPAVSTGASFTWRPIGRAAGDVQQALREAPRLGAEVLGAQFAEPTITLESRAVPLSEALGRPDDGEMRLLAKADACRHLDISGSCPTVPGEAMVLEADARALDLGLGRRVAVPGVPDGIEVVGTYTVPGDTDEFWYDLSRLATAPPRPSVGGALTPYRPAPFIVAPEQFGSLRAGSWRVHVDRLLEVPPGVTPRDVSAARHAVLALPPALRSEGSGRFRVSDDNALQYVLAEIQANRETVRDTVTPAAVSLILVALALLLRLLAAAAGQRRSELALASLRGMSARQLWTFGLTEPLVILLAALPLGAAVGILTSRTLTREWLARGVQGGAGWLSAAAVLLVVVAAAVATAVTVGRALAEPLSSQLAGVRRPSRSSKASTAGGVALWAAAVAMLVASLTSSRRSSPDPSDLVLPVLLSAAAGLLVSRVVMYAASRWARRRAGRSGITGFLAVRTVSRRRDSTLVVLPLTAALAISVFAIGVYGAAATWRDSVAATRVGADLSYRSPLPLAQTVEATHRIDPDGRWLMTLAVVTVGDGEAVVVDAPRLARVADWPSSWTPGMNAQDVSRALSPAGPGVTFSGSRLALTLDNDVDTGGVLLGVSLQLVDADGLNRRVFLGPYAPGTSTHRVAAPFCRERCQVKSVLFGGPAVSATSLSGLVEVVSLTVDGAAVTDFENPAAWRPIMSFSGEQPQVTAVDRRATGLVARLDTAGASGVAGLTPDDVPARRPVLLGRRIDMSLKRIGADTLLVNTNSFDGLPVRPVARTESMPYVGPRGLLIDYTMITRDSELSRGAQVYVLARDDSPGSVLTALSRGGYRPQADLDSTRAVLGQDAYALALRLYLVVASAAVALAAAGLSVHLAVSLPGRRRDAASLRVVGVRRRSLVRAVFIETCAVLGAAGAAGIAAGSLAQYLVVRTLTLGFADDASTPRVVPTLDADRLALLGSAVVAAFAVFSIVSAVLVVRRASASTLRETVR